LLGNAPQQETQVATATSKPRSTMPVLSPDGNLSRYLEQIRSFPMLEPKQEYMLAKAWKEKGDVDSAHQLVTSHLRLVAKIAMGYRGYGLPVADHFRRQSGHDACGQEI